MSPTPNHRDDNHRFDPRSEVFLASLRNLIEFKVTRQNFDENRFEVCSIYSRSMIEALEYAASELEGSGWHLESITRVWDERFFASLNECDHEIPKNALDDGFISIMQNLFNKES